MTYTLSRKLNTAFLGLTLVVLIATLGLARWSFDRGFLDFINTLAKQRLERIAEQLARDYHHADDNWNFLTPSRFEDILRMHSHRPHPRPPLDQSGNRPLRESPWERPPPPTRSDEPPEELDRLPPPPSPKEPENGEGHPPFPPPFLPNNSPDRDPSSSTSGRSELGPPTTLLDRQGMVIAGVPLQYLTAQQISVPILVGGNRIGELRSNILRRPGNAQETAFSRQQRITSLLIAMAALGLATLVSILLSRRLLAPIHRLIEGAKQLAQGNYPFRLNEDRHDELGDLIHNMNALAMKLEENRSARNRWIADISHELRTPITVLTGEIEAIRDRVRPLTLEQIDSLYQETTRLRHLIDDLYQLSLADIGGLNYTFQPTRLSDSIHSVVHRIQPRAESKGIRIKTHFESNPLIQGDIQRLEQLFTNLLENALAYTDAPGEIRLSVEQSSKTARIQIEDTPPGVTENECQKLFDPLYRLEASRNRQEGGAGLGLAICQKIVKAHQGQITAKPASTGGLHIEIEFPLIRNDHAKPKDSDH